MYHQKQGQPSAFIRSGVRKALASHALSAKMGVAIGPLRPEFLTAKSNDATIRMMRKHRRKRHGAKADRHFRTAAKRRARRSARDPSDRSVQRSPAEPASDAGLL